MSELPCPACAPFGRAITELDELYRRAVATLVPAIPQDEHVDFVCRCPTCGEYFRSSYEVETDVNSRCEYVSLTRLSLGDAAARGLLSENDRTLFVTQWTDALAHPSPSVRAEAAWNLESLACHERHADAIVSLLSHEDNDVRESAARSFADQHRTAHLLSDSHRTRMDASFAPAIVALVALAEDPIATVRRLAVTARTFELFADEGALGVQQAIARAESPDALEAVFDALGSAPAQSLADALEAILTAGVTRWTFAHPGVIARALTASSVLPAALSTALERARQLEPRARASLLFALQHWPSPDPSLVAFATAALASNDTRTSASAVLRKQSERGADVREAITPLGAALKEKFPGDVFEALVIVSKHPDTALDAARAMTVGLGGAWSTSIACALSEISKRVDLRPIEHALDASLAKLSSTDRRYVLCALLRGAMRDDSASRWLAHDNRAIREDAAVASAWLR